MSIKSVIEDYRGLSCDTTAGVNSNTGSMRRFFSVEFDGDTPAPMRPVLALSASGIPDYWQVLDESLPYWYVSGKSCQQSHGPFLWLVTVNYTYYDNPLMQPAKVWWERASSVEPIDTDFEGHSLENSAHEPFDPPVQKQFLDRVLCVERNEAGFNQEDCEKYIDAINSTFWTPNILADGEHVKIFFPYTVKCNEIIGFPERVGNIYFHTVKYRFQIRVKNLIIGSPPAPVGWRRRILDQGFREYVDGKQVVLVDEEGRPYTLPVKLNGSGRVLNPETDEDVYRVFSVDDEIDFAGLNL